MVGKKIVVMHVQPESETCASVLWSGNTWNYRSALDEAGVRGAYVDEENGENSTEDGKRKYFRILRSFDVAAEQQKVQDILKEVFSNLAMKCIVESEPIDGSAVAEWFRDLRQIPSLHFEK